jgi:hypothetical protein
VAIIERSRSGRRGDAASIERVAGRSGNGANIELAIIKVTAR